MIGSKGISRKAMWIIFAVIFFLLLAIVSFTIVSNVGDAASQSNQGTFCNLSCIFIRGGFVRDVLFGLSGCGC